MKDLPNVLLLLLFILGCPGLTGQLVEGHWQTIDDKSGEPKAVVEIWENNGRLYGTVRKILVDGKENARCTACRGKRRDVPIVGMQIIDGLEKTGEHQWQGDGDSLFDPEQGKSFRSKIWLDPGYPDELKVRGYWMLFYRTQTWKRLKAPK